MHDLFEYLYWRGDIPFTVLGPVNADYAVFCSLSYIPYECVFESQGKRRGSSPEKDPSDLGNVFTEGSEASGFIRLDTAARMVLKTSGSKGNSLSYHLEEDPVLLEKIMESERFGEVLVGGYVNIFDPDMQEQFCAMTFLLPNGDIVVTFRGTDGTITGWREDFNMGFMDELPSQRDAIRYLNLAGQKFDRPNDSRIYVCGHSKGGNLAMYAAAFADKAVQDRIAAVRSLDGPGFKKRILSRRGFERILDRTESFMPQSSIVGLLLEHREKNRVIHSFAKDTKQHNVYTWSISGGDFTEETSLSESSIRANRAINKWIEKMSDEDRMRLTDGIFVLFEETEVETLSELFEAKNLFAVMKNIRKMDDKTKELIGETGRIIMKAYRK